ncbi:50S ribosomal protein L29 [candidate division WWE3 bacterium RIFCSPHIGHO2_01_FULL_40_23]|uniref:Large ribosomal subunit protein uL29 n=1 Tax=candidate division WWE3 bacterium RIFCSPLOWO2_01_FULL_41_18 TaxID=1802625 RepID=A0A1F4VDE4_UNCKA|nr:MAG: 50S ribosomal protein L29 [candidate division WWE3 bacterium RIFCSPHIGHO2_01_FULL_40_23]OGC55164.1 MAG: 50S ribosomal protein L29 [candidate division WWE3 bacterium RIFCSPLOWO2_01_FULL_41_18]
MTSIKDYRGKTKEEVRAEVQKKKEELSKKREDIFLKKEKNTSLVKDLKKDIARLETVLSEKEILEEV